MTKPVSTGKVAIEVYELIAEAARRGKKEAIDELFLMVGEDYKSATERNRSVIDLFDLIERAANKMTDLQINAAKKLLTGEIEK